MGDARRSDNGQLPSPLTGLVGRCRERNEARALLRRDDVRLVTLTGPGGVGKTRLALAVAADAADLFADGVAWVPLAAHTEPDAVQRAIAQRVSVTAADQGHATARALQLALRDARLLLVLDNFEQALAAAPLLADLLSACPGLTALVTSRARLRVSGEWVLPVEPLSLPPTGETAAPPDMRSSEAVQLFVERARAVAPAFALTPATSQAVATIVRQLDGLPLAIELAAARISHLDAPTLAARLGSRLALLTGGPRDLPTRQRTMRDAIAWSHDLLTPEEQRLFRRLAVFADGFTLDAAEAVAAGGDAGPVVDTLGSLVEKSLVLYAPAALGGPRYGMLETIRAFAAEQLEIAGDSEGPRRAHAAYFLAMAEARQPAPFLPDNPDGHALLAAEQANFRAALGWLASDAESPALFSRLAGALAWYWFVHGQVQDAQPWLERALARGEAAASVRTRCSVVLGMTLLAQGDLQRAADRIHAALVIAREAGDALGTAQALIALGAQATVAAEYERATAHLGEALAVARSLAEPRIAQAIASAVLGNLGDATRGLEQFETAAAYYEDALAGQRAVGSLRGEMLSLIDLANLARERGDAAGALERYRQGLALARAFGERRAIVEALEGIALTAVASGRPGDAVRLLGAAEHLRESAGLTKRVPLNRPAYEHGVAVARAALDGPAFAAAWSAGQALSLDQAVANALELCSARGGAARVSLTPREAEILPLIAAGRTDREIGAALFLSHRTVEHHVARLLAKLGAHSRAEAIATARAIGLLPSADYGSAIG